MSHYSKTVCEFNIHQRYVYTGVIGVCLLIAYRSNILFQKLSESLVKALVDRSVCERLCDKTAMSQGKLYQRIVKKYTTTHLHNQDFCNPCAKACRDTSDELMELPKMQSASVFQASL